MAIELPANPVEFTNISFIEYSQLSDRAEIDYILKYSRKFNLPIDVFNVGDLTKQPFGLVKDLQYDLNGGVTWMQLLDYFEKLTGKPVKEISKEGVVQIIQFKAYVFSEIERINEIVRIGLASSPDADEEKAGIDRFAIYGNYIQFVDLANDDITRIEQIKKLPYIECFMLLKLRHDRNEYQRDLMRIKSNIKQ